MRILIADDDDSTVEFLGEKISEWGYGITTASDGNKVMEILEGEDPPELVILDWVMPGLDGVQICEKVQQGFSDYHFYIIMLTGKSKKEDIIQALESGADDYVSKPFNNEELKSRIKVGERIIQYEHSLKSRVVELENVIGQIKLLREFLPICVYCKKIRQDEFAWEKLDKYIEKFFGRAFHDLLCEDCQVMHMPELIAKRLEEHPDKKAIEEGSAGIV